MGFIGVIDSGVGGLTILQKLLNDYTYNFVYIADHAFCPYGVKPNDVIYNRAGMLTDFLKNQGAQAIVLACNTLSVFANRLQQDFNLPVYDVITPTCRQITQDVSLRSVALLATQSTIANNVYQSVLSKCDIEVVPFDCSSFVPFIEQRSINSLACQQTVDLALRHLPQTRADAVILGCTHFPLLRRQISYYCFEAKIVECRCDLPSDIDGATDARQSVRYYTTGDVEFANAAAAYFKSVNFTHVLP